MSNLRSLHQSSFSVLLDTRRDAAELMAECRMRGAITTLPVDLAWRQGVVHCCECGTAMKVTPGALRRLQGQAHGAGDTIHPSAGREGTVNLPIRRTGEALRGQRVPKSDLSGVRSPRPRLSPGLGRGSPLHRPRFRAVPR